MANTLFIGKVYRQFDELSSTNDYARELIAKSTPPEGTAIRAASQSAGRGQFGSHWESPAGANLLISIILHPSWLSVGDQFRLSEIAALALRDVVAAAIAPDTQATVRIKWPNDICIQEKKTAGILIQNTVKGSNLDASIIGIGLNVNQVDFPDALPNATSLALASGQIFNIELLAENLFERLEQAYLQLKNGKTETLRATYHHHLLGRSEMRLFRRPDGSHFQGKIQGVALDGRLITRVDNEDEYFAVKTVQML